MRARGTYTVALTVHGPGGSDSDVQLDLINVAEPPPVARLRRAPDQWSGAARGELHRALDRQRQHLAVGLRGRDDVHRPEPAAHLHPGRPPLRQPDGHLAVGCRHHDPGRPRRRGRAAARRGLQRHARPAGLAPLLVDFTDLSAGAIASWSWSFGDGGSSSLQHPAYTFSSPGTYTVSLDVSSAGGTDTITQVDLVVVMEPPPAVAFEATPTSGLVPLPVSFNDLTTGDVTDWSWDFGDGTSSTLQNPSHTYTVVGTYTVALTATGLGGASVLTEQIFVLEPPPVASFSATPTSGMQPVPVAFTGPDERRRLELGLGLRRRRHVVRAASDAYLCRLRHLHGQLDQHRRRRARHGDPDGSHHRARGAARRGLRRDAEQRQRLPRGAVHGSDHGPRHGLGLGLR